MKKTILFLVVAIIFAGCGWLKGGDKSQPSEKTLLTVYSDVQERTPNGILIASKNGTSSEFKATADNSLNELFADAAALGYTQNLNFSDYIVYVLDNCTPSPEQGVMSFRVRADEYDGTIFDQDARPGIGYILASEFVIKEGDVVTNEFVVCKDPANDDRNLRYGPEHIILARNNPAEYQRTEFHGSGIYHPLIAGRNNFKTENQKIVVGAMGAAEGRIGK